MIESLRLQNFRSYKDAQFDFSPGVNVVVGPNGSGKTNLLEALYVLSRGTTFRGDDHTLIRHRASWARLDATVGSDSLTLKLQRQSPSPRKTFLKNNKPAKRPGLAQVLFEPDQLRMVHGPPELRRGWIDNLLTQLYLDYADTLQNYQRALRQRNRLLHQGGGKDDFFVWEIKLSEYGAKLVERRVELIQRLDTKLQPFYHRLTGSRDSLHLAYQTPFGADYASQFMSELARRRAQDTLRGYTSVGPHRDDLRLEFNKIPVADIASRGERRTLYLTLKFLEAEVLEDALSIKPIMLLDDLFGELDDRRKRHLQSALVDHQIIITSTDDHPAKGILPATKRVIKL